MGCRVVVVDDHGLVLAGVRLTLELESDFELVGEARSGAEALPTIGQVEPDLVLLDLNMPLMDGLTCLGRIHARFPQVKVVIFSASDDQQQIERALALGASGYIGKSLHAAELAPTLRQALERPLADPVGLPPVSEQGERALGLSKCEAEILRLVAAGLANRAIARKLFLSEQTVKFHLTNIFCKLGVKNRIQAVRCAFAHGLAVSPLAESLLRAPATPS
jgi:two-component system nitrate/nitrite response regulator NarL